MAESGQGAQGANEEPREPFVSQGDRPEVRLDPDAPLSELRVRDLAAILGPMAGKNPNFEVGKTGLKDFFDKPSPEVAKDFLKEVKSEKLEIAETGFDPTALPGPDPRLDQVIQAVTGMNTQVSQLADQVAELQRRLQG